MTFIELIIIALGLSMDAFAVSVSNSMTVKKFRVRDALTFGLFFGAFQAIMPLIGWLFGNLFSRHVTAIDHWIAFVLLSYIGIKMIYDARTSKNSDNEADLSFKVLLFLAIATSIDALAVGVTFAFMKIDIILSIAIIGIITFIISFAGTYIGHRAGGILGDRAQTFGGVILILIGLKILIEHLFF